MRRLGTIGFVALSLSTAVLTAHVRLRYASTGAPLFWGDERNISLAIQIDGSDDISDGSHETAIRNAIEVWNDVDGSRARIVERTGASVRSRTDWQDYDLQTVLWDEADSSGYFPGASGVVAITPLTFYTDGLLIDADIIFNGKNFSFTTSGQAGRFDVQDVAAHEIGHFLGLDHSGVCGATMYPYVDSSVILHRSLSLDDRGGLRHIYSSGSFGSIEGVVEDSSDEPVRGAHIVARDASGRLAGSILSASNGSFRLRGLEPGTYTVYADPLDDPVSTSNLGGGQIIDTDFESSIFGTFAVSAGQTRDIGPKTVGGDVSISVGRVSDDYPIRLVAGATTTVTVRGDDLDPGSTLTVSDPTFSVTNIVWNGASVNFDVQVPAGAEPGHVDVTVEGTSNDTDILVGGLEVTPPDPVITSVTPATGAPDGGASMTITGTGFRAGARVVVGDRIYVDGRTDGCVVVDSTTIQLETMDTIAGTHDVVVIDETGVEGRGSDMFQVAATPVLQSTFPAVGAAAGGTTITISGEDFVPGTIVEIDSVVQPSVTVESPDRLTVVTGPGVVGGPYVMRVTAPGGLFAETAFAYVASADPKLLSVSPDGAHKSGGEEITVRGTGFRDGMTVTFGADTRTGEGGRRATTEFVNTTTLRVTSPKSSVGTKSVMVEDDATGQAHVLSAAFTFTGSQEIDSRGGSGCAAVPLPPGPPRARDVVGGAGWIVVLYLILALRSRRVQVVA